MARRHIAAVIGSATADEALYATARELGTHLVDAGFRVASGGLKGVMEAVCRGAHESARYTSGDTIAILPTYEPEHANKWVDIAIPTGLQHARNTIVVSSADVVIAVGGGAGTLSEIAMAWALGRPVIALRAGGWAERLGGDALDGRRSDRIHGPCSPAEAASLAQELVCAPRQKVATFITS